MRLIFCLLLLLPILSTNAVIPHYKITRINLSDPVVSWAGWYAIIQYNNQTNNNLDLKIVLEALKGQLWTGDVLIEKHILLRLEAVSHDGSCSVEEYVAYLVQYMSNGSTSLGFLRPSSSPWMEAWLKIFETTP